MDKFLEQAACVVSSTNNTVPESTNIIKFTPGDKNFCHKITKKSVKIICSAGDHDHGSSKVKLKNIVDYKWEVKKYPGHLIAVHMDGKHIAYVIKVNNKQSGAEEGMVRVVNTLYGQRALIKGITGEVLDVQFAHIQRVHILACIDLNSLYVYKIDMLSDILKCNLLLKIEDPLDDYNSKYNKISWCPFYQEEYTSSDDEGEDASQLVVWSRGKTFQCFNVNIIINSHGIGKHLPKDLTDGYINLIDNSITITWISLSPDGTTLSVGSEDGFIRFYQIYFHEKQPRCLHQWKPHNGKPISSFFFLDNYLKKSSSDTFWKHALTGSNFNTEFKIWDCGTWECLQQIQLVPAPSVDASPLFELNLTAEIDITSSYLVLSNIDARTLYILQLSNSCNTSAANNNDKDKNLDNKIDKNKHRNNQITYIRSVSEFPVSSAILSYSIVNAVIRKLYKCAINDSYLLDDTDYDYDDESSAISCVVLRMFVVQPKSVQECHILYEPIQLNDDDDNNENILSEDEFLSIDSKNSNISNDDGKNLIDVSKIPYKDVLVSGLNASKKQQSDLLSAASNVLKASTALPSDKPITLENEDNKQKIRVIDDSILLMKSRKSPSPLIPGLPNLEAPQVGHDELPTAPVMLPPTASSSTINHAQKSHFSQINLMTPDAFSASSSASSIAGNIQTGAGKKSPSECVNSDVLSTILMLASVTGSQSSKHNAENLNLLNFMNSKMIEDQEFQKQFRKSAAVAVEQIQQQQQQETTSSKLKRFASSEDDDDEEDDDDDDNGVTTSQNNSDNLTSGGSSPPSREVQEIMSLKDYELKISSFSYNDSQDLGVDKLPQLPETFLNTNEVINTKTQHLIQKGNTQNNINADYKNNNKDDLDNRKKNTPSDSWPKVPDFNTVGNKKGQQQHGNDILLAPILAASNSASNPANFTNDMSNSNNVSAEQFQNLSSKIDQLINVIHLQSTQINGLQTELQTLKSQKDSMNAINTKQQQANLIEFNRQSERQFVQHFEQYIKRYDKEHRVKFDEYMKISDTRNRELRDRINQENEISSNQLCEKISQTIKMEMQRNVIPVLLVKLEKIKVQIQSDVSTKLTATDIALRENISQLCKSKSIIETFGKSVLHGVQGSLQAAFIESMSSTLIPAYEKSSQNMFRQLHETFSIGIKQVMEQFDNYLTQLQPVQDTTDEILRRCLKFRELLEQNLTRQTTSMSDSFIETKKDIKNLEINFMRHFSDLVKKEIRKSFEMQVASLEDSVLNAVRSQANTPAPSHVMSVYDVQDQIKHLLSSGQINGAFHQALLANDLNLVEYTLEKADYKTVFNPCALEQTVLLSLIQQITADMSQHNDIKQKYLADGILNLNPSDPITKEHAPKVMKELYRNCQSFLSANPKSALCSNVRMIMMAIQGISSLADNSFL